MTMTHGRLREDIPLCPELPPSVRRVLHAHVLCGPRLRLVALRQLVQDERASLPGSDWLSVWLRRVFELPIEVFQLIVGHCWTANDLFGWRVHPLVPPVTRRGSRHTIRQIADPYAPPPRPR